MDESEKEKSALVSVSVVTYNSARTIIDTIDSIYNQTYPTIELIVSDDCSTDNTVDICRDWIELHKDRFVNTRILTVESNTGVSGNLNRAHRVCNGIWIKEIAGDDILLPTCIEDCVEYMKNHPDAIILFGKMQGFGVDQDYADNYMERYFDYSVFNLSPEELYQRLLWKGNCIPAPALFLHKAHYDALGIQNDERIPLLEDYPKWLNLLKAGVKFHLLDKVIVKYRLSENAISSTGRMSPKAQKSFALFYIYYIYPEYKKKKKLRATSRYIKAAHTAWGGWFWNTLYFILTIFVKD